VPTVTVRYEPSTVTAILEGSHDLPPSVWSRVVQGCTQSDPDATVRHHRIELAWTAALSAILQVGQMRSEFGFTMRALGEAEQRLRQFQSERRIVRAAKHNLLAVISEKEIESKLRGLGFTKRQLTTFQKRDLSTLLSLKHGANFSVPGAGKTTVTFALNLLACPPDFSLFVVAPKNAFAAWSSVVSECIDPEAAGARAECFVRLDEEASDLLALYEQGHRRFVIGYDRFVKIVSQVAVFLRQSPTHFVLDEAHRIKAGEASQRGRAILSIAALPVRRDILTGTPAPHSLFDLAPQVDFLWPGSGLGRRCVEGPMPRHVLAPFYVRTTKHELQLTPPRRVFLHVEMGSAQLALYSLLRSDAIRQLAGIRNSRSAADIIAARKCVMRLLQASTNPISAVAALDSGGAREDEKLARLFQAVVDEGDSNKLCRAVQLCEEKATAGRKVVVWTIFRHSIGRLERLMAGLNPVTIFGATPTGAEEDPLTREGKLRRFHEDENCWVLIANPAACSEGISLHKTCHEALYVDRSYNAAHYLQSIDRIHRLGLPAGVETNITLLQSIAPRQVGSIDHSVSRRLLSKIRAMESILDDPDIRQLALDEEEAEPQLIGILPWTTWRIYSSSLRHNPYQTRRNKLDRK
jgi:hypothetical protein